MSSSAIGEWHDEMVSPKMLTHCFVFLHRSAEKIRASKLRLDICRKIASSCSYARTELCFWILTWHVGRSCLSKGRPLVKDSHCGLFWRHVNTTASNVWIFWRIINTLWIPLKINYGKWLPNHLSKSLEIQHQIVERSMCWTWSSLGIFPPASVRKLTKKPVVQGYGFVASSRIPNRSMSFSLLAIQGKVIGHWLHTWYWHVVLPMVARNLAICGQQYLKMFGLLPILGCAKLANRIE